jgi:hypothetical protein
MEETTIESTETSSPMPSFGQLLGQARGKAAPVTEEKASEVSTEAATPVAAAKTEETAPVKSVAETAKPIEATPAAKPEGTVIEATPAAPAVEPAAQMVPVSALQAERQKRQAIEDQLRQYQQPLTEQTEVDPANAQFQALNQKFLAQSEKSARRAHSDFDDAYKSFVEATQSNPELARLVVESEDPGEAAYQAGKNFLLAKQYGVQSIGDLNGLVAAVEKKAREDERKKATEEHQATLTAKAAERLKTPTDITTARAAGGSTESDWMPPSMGEHLKSVFKRR